MKCHKKLYFPVALVFLLALLAGCGEEGSGFTGSGPEIEWISGGTTMTYIYSHGSLAGYNLKRSFTVSKESGDVTIEMQIDGDNDSKVTGTFSVENGKEYDVSVKAGISGREVSNGAEACLTVIFSSPNCREDYEIPIHSYLVMSFNEWIPDMDYCPKSLSFGEISISE